MTAGFIVVVVFVLAVGLGLAVLRKQRERQRVRGRSVPMESLWRDWRDLEDIPETERQTRENLLSEVPEQNLASVYQSLLDFEASLNGLDNPMIALRKELMDSMDRRLLNIEILQLPDEVKARLREQSSEMMQSDADAQAYIAANDLRMAVLREYAARRFNDRIEGDWFDVYRKASRLKQKGARNFIQRTLAGNQSNADDARYETMTIVDHEIRARLLQMPAGVQFPGFRTEPEPEPQPETESGD